VNVALDLPGMPSARHAGAARLNPSWLRLQGSGESEHKHEGFTAWRALAKGTWVGGTREADVLIPWLAADLQEFYRTWLLPFEEELVRAHAADVSELRLPAGVLRALAIDSTQDAVLRTLVMKLAQRVADGERAQTANVRNVAQGAFLVA
jgi:hypothetical protein